MENWRQQYLGLEAVPPSLTEAEIDFFFTLPDTAWQIIARRRSPLSRMGLIIHIGFLRMTGRSLSSVDLIPAPVLACAARQAGMPAPHIATLRAIYRRRPTLFDHQNTAARARGLKPSGDQAIRHVTGFLRRQCRSVISRDELVRDARLWLYDHDHMLPGQRPREKLAVAAQTYALNQLKEAITKQLHPVTPTTWASELAGVGPNVGESLHDWLRGSPAGFGLRDTAEAQDRIDELKRLGAARIEVERRRTCNRDCTPVRDCNCVDQPKPRVVPRHTLCQPQAKWLWDRKRDRRLAGIHGAAVDLCAEDLNQADLETRQWSASKTSCRGTIP